MDYQFKKRYWDDIKIFSVISDNDILTNIGSWGWTPPLAQEIIDGVEASKTVEKEDRYEWANEDVELQSNKNGVLLYDWLADRAGIVDPNKLNLVLTHDEFITFMKDFKKFIEENS